MARAIGLFAVLLLFGYAEAGSEEIVSIPDPNLKAAITKVLKIAEPTPDDMLMLTSLGAEDAGIADLSGLEYAANLEILTLSRNKITDISPLLNLAKLKWVDLPNNQISHIPELSWSRLDCLIIYDNPLGDLEALSKRFSLQGMWVVLYEGNRHPDLTPPALLTATAADGETVKLPELVREKICESTLSAFNRTFYETLEPRRFADLFGTVSRRRMPHSKHLHLYVYRLRTAAMYSHTVVFAYDSRANRVSSKVCSLLNEDLYLVEGPRIYLEDLNLDGQPELVTQDADHFGTNANVVYSTYHHMDENLSFVPIFRVKTYETTGLRAPPRDDGERPYYSIVASVEPVEPNIILVTTGLATYDERTKVEHVIGSVLFQAKDPSLTFRAVEESVLIEERTNFLLRTNPLEYEYICSDLDCKKGNTGKEYSRLKNKCSRCGEPTKLARTKVKRY